MAQPKLIMYVALWVDNEKIILMEDSESFSLKNKSEIVRKLYHIAENIENLADEIDKNGTDSLRD